MTDRQPSLRARDPVPSQASGYHEVPPAPALASLVECFWTRREVLAAGSGLHNRVLPDGRIDIVFMLGDPLIDRDFGPRAGCYVVGAMRHAAVLDLVGRVDVLGVRFAPGAAATFLGVPAADVTDQVVALSAVWGRFALDLEERLHHAVTPGERLRIVARALVDRLAESGRPPAIPLSAAAAIGASHGRTTVGALCRALAVGERRLRRAFSDAVGLTPKEACRVARFLHAAALLRRPERPSFGRVAHLAGYYDQPHFVREFRRLSGLTPTAYLAERRAVRFVQAPVEPAR